MSKSKRDIIKSAIDTIVKNNGNHIDVILEKLKSVGPYISKDTESKIGHRWQIPSSKTYSFVFLQLSKTDLQKLRNTNRGKTDRLYHDQNDNYILYKSKNYEEYEFVLNSDWGTGLQPLIDLINAIDNTILSEEDKDILLTENKKPNTSKENKASSSDEGKSFGDTDTEEIDVEHRAEGEEEHHPLNLILYGPPGTGKTYNTVNEALSIIEGKKIEELQKENREDVLERFNQYKEKGQIVFTTFHQSLSYEEFIEGIKPIPGQIDIMAIHNNATNPTPGATQFGEGTTKVEKFPIIKFDVLPGIFKQLCKQASASNTKVVACEMPKTATVEISPIKIDELLKEFHEKIEHQGSITVTVDEHSYKISSTSNSFQVQKQDTKKPQSVTDATIKRDWDSFKNGEIKSDNDIRPTRESNNPAIGTKVGHWATYNALKNFEKELLQNKMQTASNESETTETISENVPQNYVLIIDEINRGNVSQIFGELITLIEEDKRTTKWDKDKNQYVDNPEKITVKLPYSPDEKPFGVPGNLYIIGTMNTADRSVEALDTALRRRFDFKEMMPKPELLDEPSCKAECTEDLKNLLKNTETSLAKILKTINKRIRVLKDREHQIGHSYFMKCKTEEDLKNVFKNNIVPLLQEYFYGNYAYIGLVLGNKFVQKDEDANNQKFATFDGKDSFENNTDTQYKLLDEEDWRKLEMKDALQQLIG